ncbi:MAG: hypothetical protein AAGA68_23510 [Pseudomonadota bacterium]
MATYGALLCACAGTAPTAPPVAQPLAPVGPGLGQLARQLIERVERESNCRYLLAGRTVPTRGRPFSVVLLSYRGPEVECRQGLEALNRHGAPRGVAFVASRLRLAVRAGALAQPTGSSW